MYLSVHLTVCLSVYLSVSLFLISINTDTHALHKLSYFLRIPSFYYSLFIYFFLSTFLVVLNFLPIFLLLTIFRQFLAFFSYLFLGEQFGPQGFLGTFFILAGVYLSATNIEGKVENENVESDDVSSPSAVNSGLQRGERGGI